MKSQPTSNNLCELNKRFSFYLKPPVTRAKKSMYNKIKYTIINCRFRTYSKKKKKNIAVFGALNVYSLYLLLYT